MSKDRAYPSVASLLFKQLLDLVVKGTNDLAYLASPSVTKRKDFMPPSPRQTPSRRHVAMKVGDLFPDAVELTVQVLKFKTDG